MRKIIGLSIIIGLSLLIGYKWGYGIGADRVGDFTIRERSIGTAVLNRDIVRGLPYAEDSAVSGLLLYVHDFIAGCTAKHGYIIPSDSCLYTYNQITGDNPVIDWE